MREGTDSVGGLAASGASPASIGLIAPSAAGTYYYGACIDSVSGESIGNNELTGSIPVEPGAWRTSGA